MARMRLLVTGDRIPDHLDSLELEARPGWGEEFNLQFLRACGDGLKRAGFKVRLQKLVEKPEEVEL